MASEKKANFKHGNDSEFQAYTNGKEYGARKIVYITISKVRGSQGSSQSKGSFSVKDQEFVDYRAGDLDLSKAAARALGFIE